MAKKDKRISMSTDTRHWTRRSFLGLGASGVALAVAGCSLADSSSPDASAEEPTEGGWSGQLVDPGLEKPDVIFTDLDGNPFPFREKTEGKLAVLFFGYTSCPDVCPIYLNTMARSLEAIGSGPGSDPMVLFVGVDVARDTPEQMRTYLDRIDPSFIGLTGPESVIAQANRELFLPPIQIEEADENGEYLVGHASKVFPFTSDDVAHRIYPSDVRQQGWVEDLPRLAEGQYR
jgi:protein SCO1/2